MFAAGRCLRIIRQGLGGRNRSRRRARWRRCLKAPPSGSTGAAKARAASQCHSSPAICPKSFWALKHRKRQRRKAAATSIHKGNGCHHQRALRMASRPRGLQPTAGTGHSALAARARGPVRIMAAWRSGWGS